MIYNATRTAIRNMAMKRPATAFISYSHRDEGALQDLITHLAMLRREGSIAEWVDQKIRAGGDIDEEVSRQLDTCDLFLPLLTPDFLASNYCYDTEMKRAIERHESGAMHIVPLVIEPCDWKASPLKRFKALPHDGKPVTEWTNKNNAYLGIVTELRRLVAEGSATATARPEGVSRAQSSDTSRRYRVKRDFDEIDRRDFRKTAFETIRAYFQSATAEVNAVDQIKARFEALGSDGFTCTVVNRLKRDGAAHITVYVAGRASLGDITYSFQERAEPNTANGWFSVECDDYDLYLASNDFRSHGSEAKRLSAEAAAADLWEDFLERAGIEHE